MSDEAELANALAKAEEDPLYLLWCRGADAYAQWTEGKISEDAYNTLREEAIKATRERLAVAGSDATTTWVKEPPVSFSFEAGVRDKGPMDEDYEPDSTWIQRTHDGTLRFTCGDHYRTRWLPSDEAKRIAAVHLLSEHGYELKP